MYKERVIDSFKRYMEFFPGLLELLDGELYFKDRIITPYKLRLMHSSDNYTHIYLVSIDSKVAVSLTLERGVNSLKIPKKLKLPIMTMGAIFDLKINIYYEYKNIPVYYKPDKIMRYYNRIKTIESIIND